MVTRNTSFVGTSGFSLPEDVLRKLSRSAFLTGKPVGPETTRAVIEGALSVGAEKASRQAALAEDRRQRDEQLKQQESQFARNLALSEEQFESKLALSEEQFESTEAARLDEFNRSEAFKLSEQERFEEEAKSARTTALFSGLGELMFAPITGTIASTVLGKAPGALSQAGSWIKKLFF